MLRYFSLLIIVIMTQSASAAPIWVERNFVPKSELIDERFLERDEASTVVIDHTFWNGFLSRYLTQGANGVNLVNYNGVTPEDEQALGAYITTLSQVDVTTLNLQEQLAFWINLYNAVTTKLILDNPDIDSIQDIVDPWDKPLTTVNNLDLTLNNIEHGIIRPVFQDNRIHYAVNCASIGCPNLAMQAYTGETVDAMLTDAAREYVNHPRGVEVTGRRVTASKIYGWYREDFGKNEADVLDHIRQYANDDLKTALEGKNSIRRYRYDWGLNNQ